MELVIKRFGELSAQELYAILQARVDVFVVEQKCPYPEIDGRDDRAYHVYLKDEEGIQAYLRVLEKGAAGPEVAIGRVLAKKGGRAWPPRCWPQASRWRKKDCRRKKWCWKPRPMPGGCMRKPASCRPRPNFWKTASPTSK